MLASTDRPGVYHITDEDASVTNLTRMGDPQDYLNSGVQNDITTDNGQCYTLYDIRTILDTTINSLLTALTNTMHVVVFKPVNVRT